jgi:hypothetical protein
VIVGGVLLYARSQVFDPASLGGNAADALADEAVRDAISPTIAAAIGNVSPENQPTDQQVADALADPRVAAAFGASAGAAARQLFGGGEGPVDLQLDEVTERAIGVSGSASAEQLGVSAEDFEAARLDLIRGEAVLDALELAEQLGWLGLILTPLGLLALLLSVLMSREHVRALSFAALALAVVALLAVALLYVGREVTLAQFNDQLTEDAVAGAWSALLGDLQTGGLILAGVAGGVGLAAGAMASRGRGAA